MRAMAFSAWPTRCPARKIFQVSTMSSPTVWGQSLFSQNKPEVASAIEADARRTSETLAAEREKAIAKRDAAVASGDAASAAALEKAIERFTAAITASCGGALRRVVAAGHCGEHRRRLRRRVRGRRRRDRIIAR